MTESDGWSGGPVPQHRNTPQDAARAEDPKQKQRESREAKKAERQAKAAERKANRQAKREAARRRLGGISIEDGRIKYPGGEGPLAGARATVEVSGGVDKRLTATRMATTGVFALAMPKKKDNRRVYLTIEGDGFSYASDGPSAYESGARRFAAVLNDESAKALKELKEAEPDAPQAAAPQAAAPQAAAPQAAAPQAAAPQAAAGDLAGQLATLAGLHESGSLSDEEFADAKARVLGSSSKPDRPPEDGSSREA